MTAKDNPNLTVYSLKGLGTHDSGTYTIPKTICCSSLSRTQNLDLYHQLIAGSRYFDYRYGPNSQKAADLVVMHGPHYGSNYYRELEGVVKFMKENPNEFIVLEVNFEKRVSNDQKGYLINWLAATFDNYTIKQIDFDGWMAHFPRVAIGEIYKRPGKRVLLITDDELFEYEIETGIMMGARKLNTMGLFSRAQRLETRWHNKGTISGIIEANAKYVEERPHADQSFFVAQYNLTLQTSSISNIAKIICGCSSARVDNKMYDMFKTRSLHRALRNVANKPKMSFAMIDFFQYDPYVIHFMIGANLKHRLSIRLACVYADEECINVTDTANRLISNQNSLWIVDFKSDLEVAFNSGTFIVAFSWDGIKRSGAQFEEIFVEVFKFSSGSQYLLNQLRGALKKEWKIEDFGNMGGIVPGNEGLKNNNIIRDFVSKTIALLPRYQRTFLGIALER